MLAFWRARTSKASVDSPLAGQSFYHCDGNGNVTALISTNQQNVASYLYDAFGNMIATKGGLSPGERVITTGVTLIKSGDKVRIIP